MDKSDKQQTWGGRFKQKPDDLMVLMGESVSFDARLAAYDIQGSRAHAKMLEKTGMLTKDELDAILGGLDQLLQRIREGKFQWDPRLEDVHMNIEQALTTEVPQAAKLHTARSRNDQIATDMRLFFKDACEHIQECLRACQTALVDFAERSKAIFIPGYTHLQRAQPVSVAHHLLAYTEMLDRDRQRFSSRWDEANVCPLGSGAIAGTTIPIDREFTARELGFVDDQDQPRLTTNSMDAVSDRDTTIGFVQDCSMSALHLSRLAEDWILWNSEEFGFLSLPDEFTTGSSLMPQKKNPDALELIRGKAGRIQGDLHALYTMVKGLPLTYNRDLQEDKPPVFHAYEELVLCLKVLEGMTVKSSMNSDRCHAAVSDPMLLATDLVDYLVKQGVAFRQAHHVIGALVAKAEEKEVSLTELSDQEVAAIHPSLQSDWREVLSIERAMAQREQIGMPGPKQIDEQIARWRE